MIFAAGLIAIALTACGNDDKPTGPEPKITTVDALLARTCELAADCVSATQEEIAACPAHLRQELDEDDLALLEHFTQLDKATQDSILQCFDAAICGRFGGHLSSMSDNDLMEPLRDCGLSSPALSRAQQELTP
jgi:hypothetical protein